MSHPHAAPANQGQWPLTGPGDTTMAHDTTTCDCCGGSLPMREVWEARRNGGADCTGSVDAHGRCRAFDDDDWALNDMAVVVDRHGARFIGNNVADEAQQWLDHGFDADGAEAWCEIGVWDAATAAEFRAAGLTPEKVQHAAETLTEGLDDPADEYTDGDPIYAACNGDIKASVIIEAAE